MSDAGNRPLTLHATGLLIGAYLALHPLPLRLGWLGVAGLVFCVAGNPPGEFAIPLAELSTAVLLPALLSPGALQSALRRSPLAALGAGRWALGAVSYGVYLWQAPIVIALEHSPWRGVITLAASLALAALSHYGLEQRFRFKRTSAPQSADDHAKPNYVTAARRS